MNVGIIGFGRFGKIFSKHLSSDFEVLVSSRTATIEDIKKNGCIPSSLEKVCACDLIIPCVPISSFESVIKKISPLLKPGSIVMDVCSVKEYPVKIMEKILPDNTQILASHPMFGPDSASESLNKKKIVMCPIRISDESYKTLKGYFEKKGLLIVESSPDQHDKDIAKTLFLTHLIGRTLIDMQVKEIEIGTDGFKRLFSIIEMVKNDSEQLFLDMAHFNKYSDQVRKELEEKLQGIGKRLEE
jgi:prephenate dehydrogenase